MKRRRRASGRGQAIAELAVVLPILLFLLAGGIDLARVYQSWVVLQSATRNGAEYAARFASDSTSAATSARSVVCREAAGLPDYGAGSTQDTCTSPTVTVTSFSVSSTAPGATTSSPLVTVTLSTSINFQTVLPYPFLAGEGSRTISVVETFSVLRK